MRQPRGGGGGQNGPQTAGILKKTGQIHAYIVPEPPRGGRRLRRSHNLSHIQGQCNAPFCTLYTRARAALSSALLDAGTDQSSTWFRRHRRLGGHCGAGSAFLSGQDRGDSRRLLKPVFGRQVRHAEHYHRRVRRTQSESRHGCNTHSCWRNCTVADAPRGGGAL